MHQLCMITAELHVLNVLHVVNKGNYFVNSHDNRKVQIVAVTLVDGFAFNVFPQLF